MEFKLNKKFKHHYVIAVAVRTAKSKNPGELFLKYKPIYFTNDDIVKVLDAQVLMKDKIFDVTQQEALKMQGCQDLIHNLNSFMWSVDANDCSVHHFPSEVEIGDPEKYFDSFVKLANKDKRNKKLLRETNIRGVQ